MRSTPWLALWLVSCAGEDPAPDPACVDRYRAETADGVFDCLATAGGVCEAGACVDRWAFGSPEFDTCADEPRATPSTLADKAAAYEATVARLHLHPALGWMMGVELRDGVDPATATWRDVARWRSGANDGLWSALYLASQAFRWRATRDPEALTVIRRMLAAEVTRMEVTGVPGLFTRRYVPPGIDGLACPASDEDYRVDVEKDDDRWVRVDEAGCVAALLVEGDAWVRSGTCPGEEFAGWCWLDNVSKDEYVGHVFALAALWKLVDEPDVQAVVVDLLDAIGGHLLEHGLALTDWDGRVTEHGDLYPLTGRDAPGLNAVIALATVKLAAEATGREDLHAWYEDCLLGRARHDACFPPSAVPALPFLSYLPQHLLFLGGDGCLTNYNNVSMYMASAFVLLWLERDEDTLEAVQAVFDLDVVNARVARPVSALRNAWFDVMWAAMKSHGSGTTGAAAEAVRESACQLRQFPEDQVQRAVPTPDDAAPFCTDRFGDPAAEHPRDVADRCATTFVWWRDPFGLDPCEADERVVHPPADYLLPYWMGRVFGFWRRED